MSGVLAQWTAVDLFAGCGGLSDGLIQAGFEVVSAVEIDPIAARTYGLNHQGTRIEVEDIRLLEPSDLVPAEVNQIHLIAGCPPCQGFSRVRRMNRRRAARDGRNSLLGEFLRFVECLKPSAVFFENVPGIQEYHRFKHFVKRLEELGYNVAWQLVDLADFGIPQRRRRMVLLASNGFSIEFPAVSRCRRTVRDALGGMPRPSKNSRYKLHRTITQHSEEMKRRIRATPKNGGSRGDWPRGMGAACHSGFDGFYDVYGRMSWDEVAPTITGGCINASKGRFLHPSQNRTITLFEAAILQTFRRTYRFDDAGGRYHVAQMIGNALPPRYARKIARGIRTALEGYYDG